MTGPRKWWIHYVVDIFKVYLTDDHVDGIGDHKHHSKKHQAKDVSLVAIITFSSPTEK